PAKGQHREAAQRDRLFVPIREPVQVQPGRVGERDRLPVAGQGRRLNLSVLARGEDAVALERRRSGAVARGEERGRGDERRDRGRAQGPGGPAPAARLEQRDQGGAVGGARLGIARGGGGGELLERAVACRGGGQLVQHAAEGEDVGAGRG